MKRKVVVPLTLIWLTLGMVSAGSSPPKAVAPSAPSPVVVSGVSITTGATGETLVDVHTSRPTAYRVMQLKNPTRLIVDFEPASNGAGRRMFPAQSPLLKDVRVGQFRDTNPAVVRVVADLSGDPIFDVHAQPGGVRIELKPRTTTHRVTSSAVAPAKPETKPALTTVAASQPPASEKPAANPSPALRAGVPAEKVKGAAPAEASSGSASAEYQNALPGGTGSNDLAASPRPQLPAVKPESAAPENAGGILAGNSNGPLADAAGQAPAAQQPKYTGEPISVNLKDVDLKDFFRLIHEISGLNIIVDPNVSGTVTLVLDSVPWDQALDIVLKNNRLDKTLEGNVLRIARVETLQAEQEAVSKLAEARQEAAPLVTVFRPINYAKADTISGMLKSWVGGGALTKRGNVLVDSRTNTLIISDIQTQIPIIESIITKLDTKAKQISIEARIVRANTNFTQTLAAALNYAYISNHAHTITATSSGTGSSAGTDVTKVPTVTLTPAAGSGFGVFAVSSRLSHSIINAVLATAEERDEAKTISAPTIVTQNNVAGTVQQGTQIPIQTTINNTISIQYFAATLQLTVTPQVTEDGNVFLQIAVQNASPGAALTSAGPSINTQQATTQVLVPDGGTVVFGGVRVTSRSRAATQVPVLGSIPLLGNLFKSSNVADSDQELLFFVTPKVLPS